MDHGHSHQNSRPKDWGSFDFPLSLFRPLLLICFFCVSALFRYDVPSPNDVWQILVQSYQKLLLHSHTWVAPGKDSSKMEPWWTMMNHEPWILEKNFKIQSVCAKSNYENTKDIKRYCNWNTHVQHQKGHGVAPDGKTSQPRSPHISKGSYAATWGELWTDLKNDRSAYCRNQGKVTKEANGGMGDDVRLHTSKSPKSPPSSDLTWPKHLPHCQPSKGQFRSYSFSEHNLFKSPLALVHFLWVSRHIPPED